LSAYHCDLKAIEYIWNIIKSKVDHKNAGQSATDFQNIMAQVREDWNSCISHVKKIETDYWVRSFFQQVTEQRLIKLGGEDSDTDSSDDTDPSISG
jgi:hypothetical protein